MTPISITMKGFMSFKDEHTFFFPTGAGLYYLRGDNRLEPRLGANGAGKSTLWAALYWVSFDTTPKGLKAGNVANWETGKGAEVVFIYEHDGAMYGVRRTWGPNTWTMKEPGGEIIDLAKSEDNPFLAHLKLAPSSFSHCILMAQRQGMFLDMKPEAKVAVLSDVLCLDTWIERSAVASKQAAEQDRKTRLLEQRVADLEGQLRGHNATDYTAQAEAWEKARSERMDALAARHEEASKVEKQQRVEADAARIKVDSLAASLRDATYELEGFDKGLRDTERELAKLVNDADGIVRDRTRLDAELVSLKKWRCPACSQALPNIDVEVKQAAHHKAAAKVAQDAIECDEAMAAGRKRINELTACVDRLRKTVADRREALLDAERTLAGLARSLQFTSRDLDHMEDEGEKIEADVNPFTVLQTTQRDNRAELEQRLKDSREDLDDSTTEHALQLMWVKGFKEIRLFDMASALTELEVEVNSSVSELGLQDWSINFALDRETAKGDVKRGFSVFVQSPANKRPVPWEAWSGGEGQRLRVSGTMGLSDLIRSQSGASLGLEVWDEPTDGLSPEGINDLLACLKDRATRENRQIWVVDHRALGYGAFDGIYTVVKDATGSHIIEGD